MWLFTRHGFFSCTCADANHSGGFQPAKKGEPSYKQPKKADLTKMMVRARIRQHLLNVQVLVGEALAGKSLQAGQRALFREVADAEIVESKTNDYQYRILVSARAFRALSDLLVSDIDYCNFKGAVAQAEGRSSYEEALHRIWSIHNSLQYPRGSARPAGDDGLTGFGDDDGAEMAHAE